MTAHNEHKANSGNNTAESPTRTGSVLHRNLIIENILALVLLATVWLFTQVQPTGDLTEVGQNAVRWFQEIESFFTNSQAPRSSEIGVAETRSKYERLIVGGFCSIADLADVYVQNNPALSYFIVIPAFLIVIFAYNNSSPDKFSRKSRVLIALLLIGVIIVITLKIIEFQRLLGSLRNIRGELFFSEEYDYRCGLPSQGSTGSEDSVVAATLFVSHLSTFFSEVRLYLLGIVLWIIGRTHADIRKIAQEQKSAHAELSGGGDQDV